MAWYTGQSRQRQSSSLCRYVSTSGEQCLKLDRVVEKYQMLSKAISHVRIQNKYHTKKDPNDATPSL